MYLKRIISENVGPIEKVDIKPSFNDDGSPKPLILVGENGSGKSTLLSNIVDSFYDFANKSFSNALVGSDSFSKTYYKAIMPLEIHSGQQYMYSYLLYDLPNASYFFKSGILEKENFQKKNIDCSVNFEWDKIGNVKISKISKNDAKETFEKEVACYFGPDRYEKPVWMGNSYFKNDDECHINIKENWNGVLKNPISVKNVTEESLQWLLDLIADSRIDVEPDGNQLRMLHQNVGDVVLLLKARKNIELILSKILGKDVFFSLNIRNHGLSRFRIISKNNVDDVVSPTLNALSTGQLALFNMFSTIARYGDAANVNNSIYLENTKGMVVIDEVELHLHSNLQKEILPALIKLFPKVQFIITTHSPLFLLGMRDTFGEDGFDVVEMPSGNKIDVERFREFQKAYDYYQHTQKHQEEIDGLVNQIKQDNSDKPLIITEGASDWKHLEAAYNALKEKKEYASIFEGMPFELLRYEPKKQDVKCESIQSDSSSLLRMDMGADELKKVCEGLAKVPQTRKYIIVADCDKDDVTSKLGGHPYKDWGNNVYSFVLPVPQSREKTPKICIEHLYSDEEIKTECEICGKKCRLFMGSEFDVRGISSSLGLTCENKKACGPQSIAILEGSMGEKITPFADPSDNRGLSKMMFANNILNKIPPFDRFDFSNFVEIFKIIKEIYNKDMV